MSKLDKLKDIELPEHGVQYADFKSVEGNVVISPSGLRNFIDNSSNWKENVINKKSTFTGNANTEFGSYVHLYAELFYKGKLNSDFTMPRAYTEAFNVTCRHLDLIGERLYLEAICKVFYNEYLSVYPTDIESEGYLEFKLDNKTMVAGSYDGLEYDSDTKSFTIVDFKTSNKSLNEKSMSNYYLQLNCYARMWELNQSRRISEMTEDECKKEYEELFMI
jgi:hypothetical protein